jgi:hypothetical protein
VVVALAELLKELSALEVASVGVGEGVIESVGVGVMESVAEVVGSWAKPTAARPRNKTNERRMTT